MDVGCGVCMSDVFVCERERWTCLCVHACKSLWTCCQFIFDCVRVHLRMRHRLHTDTQTHNKPANPAAALSYPSPATPVHTHEYTYGIILKCRSTAVCWSYGSSAETSFLCYLSVNLSKCRSILDWSISTYVQKFSPAANCHSSCTIRYQAYPSLRPWAGALSIAIWCVHACAHEQLVLLPNVSASAVVAVYTHTHTCTHTQTHRQVVVDWHPERPTCLTVGEPACTVPKENWCKPAKALLQAMQGTSLILVLVLARPSFALVVSRTPASSIASRSVCLRITRGKLVSNTSKKMNC